MGGVAKRKWRISSKQMAGNMLRRFKSASDDNHQQVNWDDQFTNPELRKLITERDNLIKEKLKLVDSSSDVTEISKDIKNILSKMMEKGYKLP